MKPTPEEKNCDNCSKCENIGDGCYACVAGDPIIVKENDLPGRNYNACGGMRWEAK